MNRPPLRKAFSHQTLVIVAVFFGLAQTPMVWSPATVAAKPRKPKLRAMIEIVSLTEGAEIYIDSVLIGVVPLEGALEVSPGEHVIKVTKPGYIDYYQVHQVPRSRKPLVVEADLLPFSGIFIIQTRPSGAQVFVDGEFLGETPFEGELQSGARQIQVQKGGYLDHTSATEVVAGETYFLDLNLERDEDAEEAFYTTWWFWGGVAGVAVLGVATGIALASDDPGSAKVDVDRTLSFGLGLSF